VSLNCSATDVLVALEAMDRVIAVEEDCPSCGTEGKILIRNDDHMGKSKPLSVEAVLALRPDAVLTRPSLHDLFASCGVRVLSTAVRADLTTLPEYVRAIAAMVGKEAQGELVLRTMQERQAAIQARCAGLAKVSVYYETTGLGQTAGRRSVVHAMLELAGGVNLGADIEGNGGRLSNEAIVAADPEVILLSPFADPTEAVVQRPGWRTLRAVRAGRVHRVPLEHRYLGLASPRCVDACATYLVPWLHPELAAATGGR
jgi:iron complex transport system substrate-binding protein